MKLEIFLFRQWFDDIILQMILVKILSFCNTPYTPVKKENIYKCRRKSTVIAGNLISLANFHQLVNDKFNDEFCGHVLCRVATKGG